MQNKTQITATEDTGGLELLAKQVVEGFITGLHKSPFHGFSVEFAEHRLYNTGDNVKNIDWKLFAKTEKLFTKRYEEETNLRCRFVLDTSSSMYFPDEKYNKLIFSVQSIAVLIHLLKHQRDAFALSLFSDHLLLNTPAKSTGVHQKFLVQKLEELLVETPMNVKTDLPASLHQVAELTHKRSLVIIFSDMLQNVRLADEQEDLFEALQHLKFNKHEVILFNVIDKAKEIDFNFENIPHTFVDMESGESLKVYPHRVKDLYLRRMADYKKKLQLRCAHFKIDMIDADIAIGFRQILESYLIKRQKMR